MNTGAVHTRLRTTTCSAATDRDRSLTVAALQLPGNTQLVRSRARKQAVCADFFSAPEGAVKASHISQRPREQSASGMRDGTLEAVARDFEALLVGELLKAARATGSSAWLGGEDAAADAALGLAEQEFARAIARNGGLGLARVVLQGLEGDATRSSSAPPAHTPERP